MQWFRFYNEAINDPKIIKLSDKQHRMWIGLLCLASQNDGVIPELDDVSISLREPFHSVSEIVVFLTKHALLDEKNGNLYPHNWAKRQFKSDVSTNRVKQFRKRSMKQVRNVSETPPDTEQNRADTEHNIKAKKSVQPIGCRLIVFWEREGYFEKYPLNDGLPSGAPDSWEKIGKAEGLGDWWRTFDDFWDYWTSKAGSSANKVNWLSTWRRWARKAAADEKVKKSWLKK